MEERHKTEINAIHDKYEQKIKEFIEDKDKHETKLIEMNKTISEATEKIKGVREEVKEITEEFTGQQQDLKNKVSSLLNRYSFANELFASFDITELLTKLKEQLNSNPKLRNSFKEFLHNNGIKLPVSEEKAIDFVLNKILSLERDNN